MDKEDMVYIYSEILLSLKKIENAICTNMEGPQAYPTKWSKSEKYVAHKKSSINELLYKD